jgi:two-component system, NtrC family, C4-dicarboxylate transport sensor histidine kinase DctB
LAFHLPQGTVVRLLVWAVAWSLAAVTVLVVHARAQQAGIEKLHAQGQQRLDFYLNSIEGELARYDYLPAVLALNDDVAAMLRNQADSQLRNKVNTYLIPRAVASDSREIARLSLG